MTLKTSVFVNLIIKNGGVPYAVTSAQSGGRIAQQTRMRQTTAMTRKTSQTLHTVGFG